VSDKQQYVQIKLRDLTIIDTFLCYSDHGMVETEPTHRTRIVGKGDYYGAYGDKLEILGEALDPDDIQIMRVTTKEESLRSAAHHGIIQINMIDTVFEPLVALLRSSDEIGDITMSLRARPLQEAPEILRLSFEGMDVKRRAGGMVTDQTSITRPRQGVIPWWGGVISAIGWLIVAVFVIELIRWLWR
jgi:hypothetical protein